MQKQGPAAQHGHAKSQLKDSTTNVVCMVLLMRQRNTHAESPADAWGRADTPPYSVLHVKQGIVRLHQCAAAQAHGRTR